MRDILLFLHNLTRWLVLIGGIASLIIGIRGWMSTRPWSSNADKMGKLYTISLDVQLLLGLLLYVVFSPITTSNFSDFGAAMGNSIIRFYLVEHFAIMILAIILAHIGQVRIRKADNPASKYKNATIFYGISFILVLLAIPWPFFSYGRPLLPF